MGSGEEQQVREVRRIAICGMAPASRHEIPGPDDGWEVWTLNVLPMQGLEHWDRHYEVHDFEWLKSRPGLRNGPAGESYLDWLQKDHGKPVYMLKAEARFPSSVEIPLDDLVGMYGERLPDGRAWLYCQSTVDWMLMEAIREMELAKLEVEGRGNVFHGEIGLFGVDMALGEEYAHQRPTCEYYIGVARGRGYSVYVPQTSDILKIRFVYGLDSYEQVAKKIQARRQELEQRLSQAAQNEQRFRDEKLALRGALDDLSWHEQQRY